jgi:phosphatidylglycerol---prolipoprotein diacylglyceryl transferase
LYSLMRFLIEFLRGDLDRGFLFNGVLSTSQFISLVLIGVATVLFFALKRPVQPKIA